MATQLEARARRGLGYELRGQLGSLLEIRLARGDRVYATAGALVAMGEGVKFEARPGKRVLRRVLLGGSHYLQQFECEAERSSLVLAGVAGRRVHAVEVSAGRERMIAPGAFLAAEGGLELDLYVQKSARGGLLGRRFCWGRLSGEGWAFLQAPGDVLTVPLGERETLSVDSAHVLLFDAKVGLDLQPVLGLRTQLWGGEGFYLTKFVGPGEVLLSTRPELRC